MAKLRNHVVTLLVGLGCLNPYCRSAAIESKLADKPQNKAESVSAVKREPKTAAKSEPKITARELKTATKSEPSSTTKKEVKTTVENEQKSATKNGDKATLVKSVPVVELKKDVPKAKSVGEVKLGPAESKVGSLTAPVLERASTNNKKHSAHPNLNTLVPPPPPETPTILAVPGMVQNFGSYESSPANTAQRKKDLAAQITSAKKMVEAKTQRSTELKNQATQFQSLFTEGVISKRELEKVVNDADAAVTELNDATVKLTTLENSLDRIEEKISPKNSSKGKKAANTKATRKSIAAGDKAALSAGASSSQIKSATNAAASVQPGDSAKRSLNAKVPETTKNGSAEDINHKQSTKDSDTGNKAPATKTKKSGDEDSLPFSDSTESAS